MADTKISAMPSASTLTGAELVPLVQSGANVQSTLNALTTFANGAYASFQDFTNQTSTANIPAVMSFNTTDFVNNISLVSNTQIKVSNAGYYNFQFSAQFKCTSIQLQDTYVWIRKNGVDVGGSSGLISIPNSHGGTDGHSIAGWNYLLNLAANDYIQFVWMSVSSTVSLETISAGANYPSAASVIATVNQVG